MFTYFKPHTLTLDRASPRRAHVRPRALALSPGELRRSAIALAERCFTPVALRWRVTGVKLVITEGLPAWDHSDDENIRKWNLLTYAFLIAPAVAPIVYLWGVL